MPIVAVDRIEITHAVKRKSADVPVWIIVLGRKRISHGLIQLAL
jgi:hypothetical protein